MLGGKRERSGEGERERGEEEGEAKSTFTLSQSTSLKPRFPNNQVVKPQHPQSTGKAEPWATCCDPRERIAGAQPESNPEASGKPKSREPAPWPRDRSKKVRKRLRAERCS